MCAAWRVSWCVVVPAGEAMVGVGAGVLGVVVGTIAINYAMRKGIISMEHIPEPHEKEAEELCELDEREPVQPQPEDVATDPLSIHLGLVGLAIALAFLLFRSKKPVLWLTDAYERVVDGEATVEEALDRAQELSDNYRDCIIANDAFQDMQAMSACLSELDGLNAMPGGQ